MHVHASTKPSFKATRICTEFKSPGNAHNDSLSTYSETRREMKSNKAKRHRSVHKGGGREGGSDWFDPSNHGNVDVLLRIFFLLLLPLLEPLVRCKRVWNDALLVYFSGPPHSLEPYARSPHRHRCFKSFCCEWDRCLGTNRRIRECLFSLFLSLTSANLNEILRAFA